MHSLGIYSNQQPRVLVIEEETEILQNLSMTLTAAGYITRCCSTAGEAFHATREAIPDLIICNVVIHEQGGMEICEQIKRETKSNEMPVMFLSHNQIPDIIRRRGPMGGVYYLRKPYDSEVLLDLLEKTLSSSRQMVTSVR